MKHFVHLSPKERQAAVDAVRLARDAFARNDFSPPGTGQSDGFVAEASLAPHAGAAQFATFLGQPDLLELRFRSESGVSPHRVGIVQPQTPEQAASASPGPARILPALDGWAAALRTEADADDVTTMERARSAAEEIARAAADAYDPSWTEAILSPAGASHGSSLYLVTVGSGGAAHRMFHEGPPRRDGGMTEALGRILREAADPFVHVTGYKASRPSRLQVTIGVPPELHFGNARDPVDTLRRLSSLPAEARLVAPIR